MKTNTKIKLLSSATTAIVLLTSASAFAQTATTNPADAPTAQTDEDQSVIVVTGSLIRNPNLVQANPVNVTTADQIELKQSNTAEDVLREIPGVVANIGSSVNNGNGGSSYVDLRGLGSNRNIVLLDGNRIVPADLVGRVDLNNIPLALISRVDALTGAAVTTYGADAITGVVNFVTKKNFAGLDFSVGQQLTEEGDGSYFRADLTMGANFADGRGNAVVSIGYQKSDPVYQGARDFSEFGVDSFSGTFGGSGTTVPARFSGTRPLAGSAPNVLAQYTQTGVDGNGKPILTLTPGGAANGGTRQLNPTTGQGVGTFAFFNFNPFNIFQTPFKRYNIYAQANYEVSDAVEVYTRALYSKNTVSTIIAPSGSFNQSVVLNLNNPFLPSTLRNQFCAFNTAAPVNGVDSAGKPVSGQTSYTPRFSPAECAAAATATGATDPNYRTVTVNLARRAVEVGPRISDYSTQIFDYRIGARGAITSTVNWDVNGSYGESDKLQTIRNYTLQSRFRQGLLVNGTAANPVCQTTTNGCVPVNVFGNAGTISPAAAAFLTADSTTQVKTTLAQARAVISGDLGFSSPGASEPIGFAIGTEFRNYTAKQNSDLLARTPGELGGAGGAAPLIDGAYKVYEGYGEMIVPLITDKPLFHSLTLEGGARYSHYEVKGGAKTNTFTYKVGGSWEPVADLKFRGNYAHAVRAPNIGELFTPLTTGLTNLAVDPCAGAAPTTNANLRAICLAQGAPAGQIGSIANPTAAQANLTSGGNLFLNPEKANTYTVGMVFQPSFIPRFNMSLDYYNIKVTDVIGAPLPGDLVSACFGSITAASATNPACTVIRRDPATGGLDGDPATTFGLFAPLDNQGKLFTDGFDLLANYNTDVLGFAKWSINFVGNYTRHSKFQATPTGLNRECVGYYSVNCSFTGSLQPKYQWSLRNTFGIGPVDLSFLWRHIDKMVQEPDDVLNGNGPAFKGTLPATGGGGLNGRTVDFGRIPSADYFDFTARFNVGDTMTFTATVQNFTNRKPPLVGSSIGATAFDSGNTYPSTYDALGRRYGVAVKLRF